MKLYDWAFVGLAGLLGLAWLSTRLRWLGGLNRRVGRALTPAEQWAIAASGNLAAPNGFRMDDLALSVDRTFARRILWDAWEVKRRGELHEKIGWLEREGHGAVFEPVHAFLSRSTPAECERWIHQQPSSSQTGLWLVARNPERFKNGRLVAWDQARLINLARIGRRMGWLGREEAWTLVMQAARRLQAEYGSWRELSDNYLAAREWWNGSPESQEAFRQAAEKLLADPEGPWQRLPWTTPLG